MSTVEACVKTTRGTRTPSKSYEEGQLVIEKTRYAYLRTVRHHSACSRAAQEISGICLMSTELIHRFDKCTPWFTELDHAWLKVVKRAFNKAVLLLVVG